MGDIFSSIWVFNGENLRDYDVWSKCEIGDGFWLILVIF